MRDQLLVALALRAGDRDRRRGVEERRVLDRHHEHRPAHREHPDEQAVLVERAIDGLDRRVGHPRPGRQVDRGRVRGVEADDAPGRLDDRPDALRRRDVVAHGKPGTALLRSDSSHAHHHQESSVQTLEGTSEAPSSSTIGTMRSTSSGRVRQLTIAGRNATFPP